MEIKVLTKAFDLLELAAEMSPHPLLPAEAAEALGIPRSTCVRLLKLLTQKGYLEQFSPRKGYIIGPAAALLNSNDSWYQRLTSHGERLLGELAAELKISTQLFIRQGEFRLILCGFNGDPGLKLDLKRIRRRDLHLALSGRMLLSHAPEEEQRQIIASWGEDRGVFSGMSDEEIFARLRELAGQRLLLDDYRNKRIAVIPIRIQGRIAAGAGAVWFPDRTPEQEKIIARFRKAVELVEDCVNVENF